MKYKSIGVLLFLIFTSCDPKEPNSFLISLENRTEWQNDSLGCSGFRHNFISKQFNKKQFKGKDYALFEKNFGKSNHVEISGLNKTYTFWISCSTIPRPVNPDGSLGPIPKKKVNTEASHLIIKVDGESIIQEIQIRVP